MTLGLYLIISLLVCATLEVESLSWSKKCAYTDYRLPSHVRPEHYDLQLNVDTDRYVYKGQVKISLQVDALPSAVPANLIVLHANKSISIEDVEFNDLTNTTPTPVSTKSGSRLKRLMYGTNKHPERPTFCRDTENELLVISLAQELTPNSKAELTINFNAAINDDPNYLKGFYKNDYVTKDGEQKSMVNTHFEAAFARMAFPCFDEPTFKATFDTTLVHDAKLVALSNGAVLSEATANNLKTTKFKRSPRMSTYLLAWAIGPLDYIEQVVADGRIRIRAYALPEKLDQARFALEVGVRSIAMMEEFFDVPLTMEKIDMVGLPSFSAGAMENWGLILYKDTMFLYDEKHSMAGTRGWVATTVVHELAHQWFGNLVTMAWWNDLWLNEGFATWMQNYFVEQLYPEFEWQYKYILEYQTLGLQADAEPNTHSIQLEEVGRNLYGLFDHIVYKKTAAVLKQIHDDYLGPERFREGIRKYIKKHLYGNTEASDLWSAFTEVSGLPVDKLMKSWITQPGHPEIEVELSSGEKSLHLKQRRHFSGKPSKKQQLRASEQAWMIPMTMIVADDKGNMETMKLIMDSKDMKVKLPQWFDVNNDGHWVKLNAGFKGFYRVLYSHDLVMRLEKPCRSKTLETEDRMGLLYDIFGEPTPKSLSDDDLAKVFTWSQDDQEGAILLMRQRVVNQVKEFQGESGLYEKLYESIIDSYLQIYQEHGFEIESSEPSITDASGLSNVYVSLLDFELKPLIEDALEEFDERGNEANVNLRPAMYIAVGKFGSKAQIDRLRQFEKEAYERDEKYRIEDGLYYANKLISHWSLPHK